MPEILIGENALAEAEKFLSQKKPSSVFILVDLNTEKHCLPVLLDYCSLLKSASVIGIDPGEKEKNLQTCEKIFSELLNQNADRKSLLVNLGGGVIGDIGGFVASVYKRGIDFVNLPTTLLSMCDASVGGKNGVNFSNAKNIIGTFTEPGAVFIFPDFTRTQSEREVRSGFAEIIKHFLISSATIPYELLENRKTIFKERNFVKWIEHSVNFKSCVVSSDFREGGKRKILNFGHTIGHALESCSLETKNILLHGEAVAVGMTGELFLSNRLSGFPIPEMQSMVRFILDVYSDVVLNFSREEILKAMLSDKKNSGDEIAFSLLSSPGKPAGIFYPGKELILESIDFSIEQFSASSVR